MSVTPTPEQVAQAAAEYAVREFSALDSWLSYEHELARQWMQDHNFQCAVGHAIEGVMQRIRYNKQMQGIAAQYGGGARGIARVAGMVVGEWTSGTTTLDDELNSF